MAVCCIVLDICIIVNEVYERLSVVFETYKIPKRIHIADGLPRTVSGKVICHETGYKGVNNNY